MNCGAVRCDDASDDGGSPASEGAGTWSGNISDLIGFKIIDENDGEIGVLKEVLTTSANDVYVVDLGNSKEVLIPAVKEFIIDIDSQENKIFVKLIEGMLSWSLKY